MSHEVSHTLHHALNAVRASPFDLAARAELALFGCCGLSNPQRDGQPYTYAELHTGPPVALHAPWDYGDSAGNLLESMTLLRGMNGSSPDFHDEGYARLLRKHQDKSGLLTLPAEAWTGGAAVTEMEWTQRGALMAWTTRYLAMDDQDALHRAREMVHGLKKIAVWHGDVCWFPSSTYPGGQGWKDAAPPINRVKDILTGAQIIFPLARFADATEDGEALNLTLGLLRFIREQSGAFDDDAKLTQYAGHYLYSNTGFLQSVLKYALMTREDELVAWVRQAFDHISATGTDFGFFPHRYAGRDRWQGDVCAIKDMIELAIQLGLHDNADYFAVAERYGRNHLLECQITDTDWVGKHPKTDFCPEVWHGKHPPEGITNERVCERAIGGFSGWSRVNDAFDPSNPRLIQRATAAGARAIYDLWHYAITHDETSVRVNMHFSRESKWATVTSYLPCEGHLDVVMKVKGTLAIRMPEGLKDSQMDVHVNKAKRTAQAKKGYLLIEGVQAKDHITVKWTQTERSQQYEAAGKTYSGYWRGNTLIKMDPPGSLTPLYRRGHRVTTALPRHAHGMIREIASV